ncbi:MAG TPA: response regulator, partial [Myxococcota bacterium]|nr:response regulator [Myxococcota bacterium]
MPKSLLLADDSITIQRVVGITFANEDFTITTVDNGEDAIQKARQLKPHIILADVIMPKKNGYEVCQAVKSDPELRGIPVLLLAGTFEAFDENRAREAGANGHITKPFESQALIDKVNELLAGGGDAARPAAAQPVAAAPVAQPRPIAPVQPLPPVQPRPVAPVQPLPPVQPRPVAPVQPLPPVQPRPVAPL